MKKANNFLILAATIGLFSCSSAIDAQGYTNDPWESMNRGIFAFNEGVDKIVFKPLAKGYTFVFPQPVRTGIGNFFGNLSDIGSLANALFQLDGKNSAKIAARVINNTVYGLGGLFDVATPMGNTKIEKDFGSTLAHYGVQSGPFLMLPLLGPSTLRDGIGKIPDAYLSPITYVKDNNIHWSLIGLNAIQTRASLFPLEAKLEGTSTDKYASIRDNWLQHRWGKLGTPISTEQQADIDALFMPQTDDQTVEQAK